MRHHVVLQVTLVAKLVATDRTAKFLLPVVPVCQMATQVTFLPQTFVADGTVELEETAVDGCLVKTKVVLGAQHFPANVACKLSTGRQRRRRLTLRR